LINWHYSCCFYNYKFNWPILLSLLFWCTLLFVFDTNMWNVRFFSIFLVVSIIWFCFGCSMCNTKLILLKRAVHFWKWCFLYLLFVRYKTRFPRGFYYCCNISSNVVLLYILYLCVVRYKTRFPRGFTTVVILVVIVYSCIFCTYVLLGTKLDSFADITTVVLVEVVYTCIYF